MATKAPPENYQDPVLASDDFKGQLEQRATQEEQGGSGSDRLASSEEEFTQEQAHVDSFREASGGQVSYSEPEIWIEGQPFLIKRRGDRVLLSHPDWSLNGIGSTLIEAEIRLRHNARIFSELYLSRPLVEMTADAIEMRDFLLRIID